MPRGGYRPNSGPLKGAKYAKRGVRARTSKRAIAEAAQAFGISPLEYMLAVMNDPDEDMDVRARMAIAAAPYCHRKPKPGDQQ